MTTAIQTTLASAARTATATVDIGGLPAEYTEAVIYIDVTAVTGVSASMTITYQSSPDGVTFYDHTSGMAIVAVGRQAIRVANTIGRFGRINFVIAASVSPNFTFSVVSEFKRS